MGTTQQRTKDLLYENRMPSEGGLLYTASLSYAIPSTSGAM